MVAKVYIQFLDIPSLNKTNQYHIKENLQMCFLPT